MQITIVEHQDIIDAHRSEAYWLCGLTNGPMREFRVDQTDSESWQMRLRALDLAIANERRRNAEHYVDDFGPEDCWDENGSITTCFDNGKILLVTQTYVSVFIPDDFEDQETFWVAAIPIMRQLTAH